MGLNPEQLVEALRAAFGEQVRAATVAHGETTLELHRDDALTVLQALRDQPQFAFNFLMDLSAVDYLGASPRFAVVYHLYSTSQNHRLRVKIRVVESDAWVHSASELWKSANWGERECWDMFGIRFVGHPDPRRILKKHVVQLTPCAPLDAAASGLVVYTQDWRIVRKLTADAATLEHELLVDVADQLPPDGLKRLTRALPHAKIS